MNATGTAAWADSVALENDQHDDYSNTLPQSGHYETSRNPRSLSIRQSNDLMVDAEHEYKSSSPVANTGSRRPPSVHSSHSHGPRKKTSRSLRSARAESRADDPPDPSPWIHRDKLAQIEIQEMEEAGMHVRQPYRADNVSRTGSAPGSRSVSRTGMRRAQSRDRLADHNAGASDEAVDAYTNGYDDFDRKRISVIQAVENEDEEDTARPFDPEVRRPEEVTAEHSSSRQSNHNLRPSTSRIPISKPSLTPLNANEHDYPLSGNGSNGPTSWEELSRADKRTRSGSSGSGILIDDADSSHPNQSSPERVNNGSTRSTPKAKTKGDANRRTTTSTAANRNRTPTSRRPSSSARDPSSPTHNKVEKPEGEAPWIASMYKPDPRLPPDQQLLPTIAKRMMQEQWEREGKVGSPYDRQSRLVDKDEMQRLNAAQQRDSGASSIQGAAGNREQDRNKENIAPGLRAELDTLQPRSSAQDRKSDSGSLRPGTSSGGYRITPSISSTPPPNTNRVSATKTSSDRPPSNLTAPPASILRVPAVDEKQEAAPKKACCCVMM